MQKSNNKLEKTIIKIGESSSYLVLVLIVIICIDVMMRYLFNKSNAWVIDLEWYIFSLIFLLGFSYTLAADKHVRVDVFYSKWPQKKQDVLNIIGYVFLLIPWCIVGIEKSYTLFINSFHMREGSPDPGGMPARYVIKFFIVVSFVLLLIQGVIELYKAILSFKNKSKAWSG